MIKTIFILILFAFTLSAPMVQTVQADHNTKIIQLPKPQQTGGLPLMEALAKRKSHREFLPDPISQGELSNILWAAFGINRQDGRRTIPTAMNHMSLRIYTVTSDGVNLYDATTNSLTTVLKPDMTKKYGTAPLTLLYAALIKDGPIGGIHAGAAAQNVGLYCASAGLANVPKITGINELEDQLPLEDGYQVILVQSIGHPAGNNF